MSRQRFDPLTQSLHWLTLIAVVGAYGAGLLLEEMARGAAKTQMLNTHASLGVVVLGLTLIRLAWRVMAPVPEPAVNSSPVTFAARAVHLALYAAMIAVPMIGIMMMWAKGRELGLFGVFTLPPLIAPNRPLGKLLEEAHEVAAHGFMVLAGLHAAAAILHQFVLRDGAINRMLPSFLQRGT